MLTMGAASHTFTSLNHLDRQIRCFSNEVATAKQVDDLIPISEMIVKTLGRMFGDNSP